MTVITMLDLETTGLDPEKNEILEIAVVRIDLDTLQILDTYVTKTKPEHLETAHPRALEVNGYNEKDWLSAISTKQALQDIYPKLYRCVPGGHNVDFDLRFLNAAYRKYGLPSPEFSDVHLDTQEIAKLLKKQKRYTGISVSLSAVAAYYGYTQPTPHRAYDDVMACIHILRKIHTVQK